MVCVCLSVCLPVSVRVRVRVKRKSPKTSIYQRRVSTLTLQSPRHQFLLAVEFVVRACVHAFVCVCVLRWGDDSIKPTGTSEQLER